MIARVALCAALAVTIAGAPVHAQSKKYPPEPVDKDKDEATHSQLWEDALTPARHQYDELLREGSEHLDRGGPQELQLALETFDHAIALQPTAGEGYVRRAIAHSGLQQWAACADDFVTALDHARVATVDERKRLGTCQARAGRLADAERTFGPIAAATNSAELWLRLGEVRLAMGKLDESVAALRKAGEIGGGALPWWMLAAARDRALEPSNDYVDTTGRAMTAAQYAAALDPSFSTIVNPSTPLLAVGDTEYLLGLAYSTPPTLVPQANVGFGLPASHGARPEYALVYFRRYLALVPEGPWRRRAEEHVREISALELPSEVRRVPGSSAQFETAAARSEVHRHLPALRACLAKLPTAVFEVTITKVGPRTPETVHDHPIYRVPPAGISVVWSLDVDAAAKPEIDAATSCLETAASSIALPIPSERDTFYRAAFYVTAP